MKKGMLLSLLSAVCLLASCNGGGDVQAVTQTGFINVGITMYEPMDYFGDDGETVIGFDADLTREFATSLGVTARFVPIAWDSKILELTSKKIDLIWNGMTITDELRQSIDLSLPYATNYQCVVAKSSRISEFVSADSLKSLKVAVEAGSAGEKAVSDLVKPNAVTSQEAALLEVKAGTSDCAVVDVTMANAIVGKGDFTGLATVASNKISYEKEDFGVGARKNSDLTPKLNSFFKDKYNDGTLTKLGEKYGVAVNDEAFRA